MRSPRSRAGDDSLWPDVVLGVRQSSAYSYPMSHFSRPMYFLKLYNSKQIYKIFVSKNWKKIYHHIKSIYFKVFFLMFTVCKINMLAHLSFQKLPSICSTLKAELFMSS